PSGVEGSRRATFKVTSMGSLNFARDDAVCFLASFRPPCRHFHTPRGIIIITRPWRTLVQYHRYVAAKRGLNFHRDLRRNESRRLDQPMSGFEPSRARFCAFIRRSYFKHWANLGNDRTPRKQSIVPPEKRFALAAFLLDSACAGFCLGDLATL